MSSRSRKSTSRFAVAICILILCLAALPLAGQQSEDSARSGNQDFTAPGLPTIEEKTSGMQKLDGFLTMYWDEAEGRLWLEIDKFETEMIYYAGLAAGVGSNDIGLDRGQLGDTHMIEFLRVGPKVLMLEPNYRFRASSSDPDERRDVEDAFAKSILWGFAVAARTGERILVDITDFLLSDVHGVIARLRPATYRLDRTRSAVYMPRTRAFPKNTDMEAILTFTAEGSTAGAGRGFGKGSINYVAPSAEAVTVREHHSFVEAPDDNFKPRKYDPRSGFGSVSYEDYSAALGEPITKRFIRRHRLEKRDPSAPISDPVKPIIYYLDRGVPEPVRSALIEGASWWNQAFEAAGYRNAFRIEMMPEGADTLDVRYNVIQWVHRSSRGWSYGGGITDPRTGEVVKGHVSLGSLRVRQDYLIAEGLLSPYIAGNEIPPELARMALSRMLQLAPHEVGHAIGLSHNYYDSNLGRISVMDYPQPLTRLRPDGTIDLSDAYASGIGNWDKVAVTWGYQDFPPGTDEEKALDKILDDAWDRDLRFLSNQDADLNPKVDQWANGTDAAAELDRMMKVRRAALGRFGEAAIKNGEPLALIEEALVPLYMHHRYQVEAAASALGGMYYFYKLRGRGKEELPRPVPASDQKAALDALIRTLSPAELVIPESILKILPPRPTAFQQHRELFPRNTGLAFDPMTPPLVAADLTVAIILEPERAARIVNQHDLDPSLPGLDEVLDRLIEAGFETRASNGYEAEVVRTVGRAVVDRMMSLAATAPMSQVRAIASLKLESLGSRLSGSGATSDETAHYNLIEADIRRFLERPAEAYQAPARPDAPPGAPIGDSGPQWLPPYGATLYPWWWEDGEPY